MEKNVQCIMFYIRTLYLLLFVFIIAVEKKITFSKFLGDLHTYRSITVVRQLTQDDELEPSAIGTVL